MRLRHLLAASPLPVLVTLALPPLLIAKRALADPASRLGVIEQTTETPPGPALPKPAPPPNKRTGLLPIPVTGKIVVRSGNHPGYGRLAFDFPGHADVTVEQDGDNLKINLNPTQSANVSGLSLPRNVRAIAAEGNVITLSVASGGVVRSNTSATQLVIDVLDAPGIGKEPEAPAPKPVIARARPPSAAVASPAQAMPVSLPPNSEQNRRVEKQSETLPETIASASAPNTNTNTHGQTALSTSEARLDRPGTDNVGSDLGASEPPATPARAQPPVSPTRPVPVSTNRPNAPAPVAAAPAAPAGLSNPVSRTPPPAVVAASPAPIAPVTQTPLTQTSAQAAESPTRLPPPPFQTSPFQAPDRSASSAAQMDAGVGDENSNAPAWAVPPIVSAQPVRTTVTRIPIAPDSRGAAIALPFTQTTGAAALRRGDDVVVVFDENRPLDLSPLQGDAVFSNAAIQLLQNATVLRIHLPPDTDMRLGRVSVGWSLWIGPRGDVMDTTLQTLGSSVANAQMQFATEQASKVIVVPDPETGVNLLVGTLHQPGEYIPVARKTPDFSVVPSLQGVVIEPSSDRPQLQIAAPGFVVSGIEHPLALSDNTTFGTALAEAATLTRRFDLQGLPVILLRQTLKNRIDEAAATPPLARLPKRRATAEAYLALGMGAEAQAMMRLAVMDDPRGNDDPNVIALGAMGALLAGRTEAASAIDDPRLTGTDEIKLWRAVRKAQLQEGSKSAAIDFASTDRLVLAYPDLLRDELLPLVAETEVLGGQASHAATLLDKRKDDPRLILARAFLLREKGDTKGALGVFDKLAQGRDRLLRFRASVAAIDLRLASKMITAAEAADAAEKLLFAWRGDDRERDLRFQVAAWRFQAGQWSAALAMLRESAASFPELRNQYRRQITETLRGLMRDNRLSSMDSVQLISLLEDNKDLLPDGPEGQRAAVELADRLEQLDLDQRAVPLLEGLAKTTPSPPARAAFGLRLAGVYLAAGDSAAALAAITESGSDGLSPDLVERRSIMAARADAAAGRVAPAMEALTALATQSADKARADIAEAAKDWPAAELALTSYISRSVPAEGPLTPDQSHSILRLAAAMAQANDEAGLGSLRVQYAARMQDTPDGQAFRLLTEAPVRDVSDLPRSAKEMAAARTVAAPARQ